VAASGTKQTGILIVGNILQRTFSFFLTVILARMLTRSDYGHYQQCMLIGTIVYGLFGIGNITSAILYFTPLSKDREERAGYVSTVILSLLLLGIVSGVAVGLFRESIVGFAKESTGLVEILPYYAGYMFLWIAGDYVQTSFIIREKFTQNVLLSIPDGLLMIASIAVPIYITGSLKHGFIGLISFSVLKYLFYFLNYYRDAGCFRPSLPLARKVFYFTWPLSVSGIVDMLNNAIGKMLICRNFTAADFATFSVGTIYFPLWQIVVKSVNNILRMKFPSMLKEGRVNEVASLWNNAVRKQALIMAPIYIFLLVFSRDFILLFFGDGYADSINLFRLTFVDKPLHLYSSSVLIISGGRNRFLIAISTIGLVFYSSCCFLLIGKIGLYAPIVSYAISQYVQEVVLNWYVIRHMKIPIFDRTTWWNLFVPMVLAGSVALFVHFALDGLGYGLVSFLIKGAAYVLILSALLLVTGVIRADEKKAAINFLLRRG